MARFGPYSRHNFFHGPDARTLEGKLFKRTREELTDHCGGKPNAVQRALIDRACHIRLRLACMDRKFGKPGGSMTEIDSRTYLAWCNTYGRLVSRLGVKGLREAEDAPFDYMTSLELPEVVND
jgi:hypothetical protein